MSSDSKEAKKAKIKKSDLLQRIEKLETMISYLVTQSRDAFPRQASKSVEETKEQE